MRDLHNRINPYKVTVVTISDNTPIVSEIVNRSPYNSLEFIIAPGSLVSATATFTVKVEDGNQANLSDAVIVADSFLLGTAALASFTFANDYAPRKVGYLGGKQYVRLTITPATNAASATVAIIPILGSGGQTSNPPS